MNLSRQQLRTAWYVAGVFLIVAVVVLSLLRINHVATPTMSDKLMHGIAYATLAFWFCLAFPKRWLAVFIGAVSLGVLIECLQYMLPWRAFEFADMVANTLGAMVGLAIAKALRAIGIPASEKTI